jgi:hypothetical protein
MSGVPKYEVKNVKGFMGMDCPGYNCTLYCDGKRVAKVINDGSGGPTMFEWLDRDAPRVDITFHDYKDEVRTYKGTPQEKRLVEYADSQTYECPDGSTRTHNAETLVGDLVGDYEETKQFKRWCRNKTYFRLKGDKKGRWSYFNVKYSPEVKRQIERRYGDRIEEILNERFL